MHFINPFKGLRPTKEFVSSVVIPSTDHLSDSIITDHKKNNPWSFLNVLNPKIDKNLNEKDLYLTAKKKFELMKNESILKKETTKSFYIYKISSKIHSQIGIIGIANLSAYDNLHIRGHEEIYHDRAQERSRQMMNLNAQIGPIYVIYQDNDELNMIINSQILLEPLYNFNALDGYNHSLWLINNNEITSKISEIFNKINKVYIADGHHRIEAMLQLSSYKKHQNPNHSGNESYNYTMISAFPQNQTQILDYNRLIKDLYGYSDEDFLKQVKKKFIVNKELTSYKPKKSKTFGMYLNNCWYSIELKDDIKQHNLFHINNLDINFLHYYLLEPILGIGDSRYDKRIDFLAGFKGLKELEKIVNSGNASVGFSLYPTQIEDVISFADKKLTMPPKSTWFEPKPLDGLVCYDFE